MDVLKIERKKRGKMTVLDWDNEGWTETEIVLR